VSINVWWKNVKTLNSGMNAGIVIPTAQIVLHAKFIIADTNMRREIDAECVCHALNTKKQLFFRFV